MRFFRFRIRSSFLTGLAVVLPIALSIGLFFWLFGKVLSITNVVLVPFPKEWVYENVALGQVRWYWSLLAFFVVLFFILSVGIATRNYVGRKFLELIDRWILHVPLLGKVYTTMKQVNASFSPAGRSSFQKVVLVQFPHPGHWAVGFVTGNATVQIQQKFKQKLVNVFVPTTPNPTGGFLMHLPESEVIPLEMTVADGIKHIISLGSVQPAYLNRSETPVS